MRRVELVIQGRVQGVGFRGFVHREAAALGITGWVANRPDGAVEVDAEGEAAALERLIERLREGPPHARVESIDVRRDDGPARHRGFVIRSSS